MRRTITGKNGGCSKPWSTAPWRSAHGLGAHHGYRIDGAEHARGFSVEGAQNPDCRGKPNSDQLNALNTWEDDGGRTAPPVKAAGI